MTIRRHIFTVGGTVQAGSGTYIRRAVDEELLDLCRTGTYAHVLTARQMGKSSLMVQTAESLRKEGTATVVIDLSLIGTNVTADSWSVGLLTEIERSLSLGIDAYAWWMERADVGPTQRLVAFFRDILLEQHDRRVVVFVDEIDTTLSLDFTDDFFAALRAMYNARSVDPAFERLSFVLIGVAVPGDLITDPQRTPFNIGREVDVGYFTSDQAAALAEGFDLPPPEARQVVEWILDWTGGHPFLTQRLCATVSADAPGHVSRSDVDRAVHRTFLGEHSEGDTNLRFVQDMLTRRATDPAAVLDAYRRILRSGAIADDRHSPVAAHLKLSGVVRTDGRYLRVANRLYARVFDGRWIARHREKHWIRSVPPAVRGLIVASFVAVLALTSYVFARLEADRAREEQARSAAYAIDLLAREDSLQAANREALVARRLADSLKRVADAFNESLVEALESERRGRSLLSTANERLETSFGTEQATRRELEATVSDLERSISENEALNRQLQSALSDERSSSRAMRVLAVSIEAQRHARRGDSRLAGLLARRALLLADSTGGTFGDVILGALREALNTLAPEYGEPIAIPLGGNPNAVIAMEASGEGVMAGLGDGTLRRWAVSHEAVETHRIDAHAGPIRAVTALRGRFHVATAGDDGRITAWVLGPEGSAERQRIGRILGGVEHLAADAGGELLAAAGANGAVLVWSLADAGRTPIRARGGGDSVQAIALDGPGDHLAWADADGVVHVTDLAAPEAEAATLRTRFESIHAMVFQPGAHDLAVAGSPSRIEVWSLDGPRADWVVKPTLEGHSDRILTLAYDGSGRRLFSGSVDGTVLSWEMGAPDPEPMVVELGDRRVAAVATTYDGLRLAAAGSNRTLNVWSLDLERLSLRICSHLGSDELTRTEWGRFLGADRMYLEGGRTCPGGSRPMLAGPGRETP